MIYVCTWCKEEIEYLRTPGDEVCEDFVGPLCAQRDHDAWQQEVLKDPNPDPSVLIV